MAGRVQLREERLTGTFAIYFSIYLTDLPDLKFDYDQTTFEE